ncbi:MaoC/PaaZ C-terminal domain-containing protein [Nocardioides marmoribigeumensis]|jgi:acyl dehydratase|uniref:Acyl dehydratase n=1 Tax=Nocardioides marmoribigeumensis TaxID=433649 RepID=A0ABU2BW90_9ACTN|nr:MaoC/PaaZ C-terminal domain-containing protein [Nocardioides marmoribigeumensis]MDR7362903.1 acyl dehydratase [Nocardioides marmoribigeumensis]
MTTFEAGQALPPHEYEVTRADLVAYAEASGDDNPIHQDEDVAQAVGLPGVIAHGMFTLALASRAVEEWAGGPGRVRELGAKFTRPVVVHAHEPAYVAVVGVVRSVEPAEGGGTAVTVALEVTCGIDKVLGAPKAVFVVPDGA